MSQIEDLQARISRALDRIGQGIDGVSVGPAPEEFDALRGRAEAAEQALAETQQALAEAQETMAAAQEQAEVDRDAAVAAVQTEAEAAVAAIKAEAADALERALIEARPDPEPQPTAAPEPETNPVIDTAQHPDMAALQEALEDEKMANAQLEERLRVLKERMASAPPASDDSQTLAALDAELHKLRAAQDELLAANAALREANAQGVGEPELINRGLEAELETLRAARAADAAEAGAVLGALSPLLAEATEEGTQA